MMKCKLILTDFNQFKHFTKSRFKLYVKRYIAYARLKGYESFNDWPYHKEDLSNVGLSQDFISFGKTGIQELHILFLDYI